MRSKVFGTGENIVGKVGMHWCGGMANCCQFSCALSRVEDSGWRNQKGQEKGDGIEGCEGSEMLWYLGMWSPSCRNQGDLKSEMAG